MGEIAASNLVPTSLNELIEFAKEISKSTMIPKEYIGNPGNCLVAIQWGMEIGLHPLQGLQSIAVINGRPTLFGDAALALVRASPVCEYVEEGESDATKGVCRVKRRGEPEHTQTFTLEDAKKAGLLGKTGPWTQYQSRMLIMRARSWALRDKFADVLRGLGIAEEVRDIEIDITPRPQRENPVSIAQAAIKPADDDGRAELVAMLENIAEGGTDALLDAWNNVLTKEQRKLHGGLSEDTKIKAKRVDDFMADQPPF